MKNLFLVFIAFIIIPIGANAYQVNYNSAGGITSVTGTVPTIYGPQTYVNNNVNNFGSNALFTPNNIRRISEEQRRIKNEQTYLENTKNINVNINHNGLNPYRYNNGYYGNYYNNIYSPNRMYNYGTRYYNNGFNKGNTRGLIIY
jgi:hypothetical protein